MRRRRLLTLAACVLALGGCGRAKPLSTGALRLQAAAACASASARTAEIPLPDLDGGEAFLRRGLAVLEPTLAVLRRLHPAPPALSTYRTALASMAGELQALEQARGALAHGEDPVDTMRLLQQRLTPLEARGGEAWRALGAPACVGV